MYCDAYYDPDHEISILERNLRNLLDQMGIYADNRRRQGLDLDDDMWRAMISVETSYKNRLASLRQADMFGVRLYN